MRKVLDDTLNFELQKGREGVKWATNTGSNLAESAPDFYSAGTAKNSWSFGKAVANIWNKIF